VLTILRDGWTETKEFKITRDVINIPIVKLEIKSVENKKIAYLALYHFTDNSTTEFSNAVQQILTSGAEGIVLDLRNNPGGYLESSVEIASWFLDKDQLVVAEDYGNGKKIEHKSSGINKLNGYPVAVLINQGSASASEILAGALRDNKGIKLIGEKSFGKGSVQELEQLSSGTSLKITVAKWLTPSGHSIMDDGLEPDVKVEITNDDVDNGRDPQLDRALELLK
jgi:carboxyl-terminal processing protease